MPHPPDQSAVPPPASRAPLRFIATTLLCLLALELLARLTFTPTSDFWQTVDRTAGHQPISIIFVGTSRTAASIDLNTVADNIPADRYPHLLINAGMGNTTPAEYFLALRNTLHDHPENLKGAAIFIEAAGGFPDPQSWQDPWPHADRPEMLTPLLRGEDLPRFWSTPRTFEEKLDFTADYFLRGFTLYTHRQSLGNKLIFTVRSHIEYPLDRLALPPAATPVEADLTSAGGIRRDAAGIALARQSAHDYAHRMIQSEQPIVWSNTIIADLVRLAAAADVQIIFFTPPLHTLHRSIYETSMRQADRARFAQQAAIWHTPVLAPDFPTTDADFPDIWHLKRSLAPAYTTALLAAWNVLPATRPGDGDPVLTAQRFP